MNSDFQDHHAPVRPHLQLSKDDEMEKYESNLTLIIEFEPICVTIILKMSPGNARMV